MRNEVCLLCQKPMMQSASLWNYLTSADPLCEKCRHDLKAVRKIRWIEDLPVNVLYEYNEVFQKAIMQYKECCDEALASVFLYDFISSLKRKYKDAVLIPMPSSKQKKDERGFDHVEKMFECLGLPFVHCFYKREDYDQKSQNKLERSQIRNVLCLDEKVVIPNKKIVLVDDICTSGSTFYAAYQLIKAENRFIEACAVASVAETVGKRRRKRFEKLGL